MKGNRFTLWLGLLFLGMFAGFFAWQTPFLWRGPMTQGEVDRYATEIGRNINMPAAEKAAFVARVRQWAVEDDGRPVLLVNLMRYRKELGPLPAGLGFKGTPAEANALYERTVAPLALKRGEYPLIGGETQARDLTGLDAGGDAWDRVVVMRAPSRRAFVAFMADPAYGPAVPYRFAAEEVAIIPVEAEMTIPDLRWIAGLGLLSLYFLILWRRAARRAASCAWWLVGRNRWFQLESRCPGGV